MAVVEAAYSIAEVVSRPIEPGSIARALRLVEADTLDEALHGEALRRRGWLSLVEAIDAARDALREALGDRVCLQHQGGSRWLAVVPGVQDEQELADLLDAVRVALHRRAPNEHVLVAGAIDARRCA